MNLSVVRRWRHPNEAENNLKNFFEVAENRSGIGKNEAAAYQFQKHMEMWLHSSSSSSSSYSATAAVEIWKEQQQQQQQQFWICDEASMIDSWLTKHRGALIRTCGDHWRIKAPYQSAADRLVAL